MLAFTEEGGGDEGGLAQDEQKEQRPLLPCASNLSAIAANALTKKLIIFRKQFKQVDKKRNTGKKVKKILDFNEALLRLKDASGEDISLSVYPGCVLQSKGCICVLRWNI